MDGHATARFWRHVRSPFPHNMSSKRTSSLPPSGRKSGVVQHDTLPPASVGQSVWFFVKVALLSIVGIGLVDHFFFDGITHSVVACPSSSGCNGTEVRRLGLHQGSTEAYLLYFFISHVYDRILNPWHWTTDMRTAAIAGVPGNKFDVNHNHVVLDVGAGTGFTTEGVLAAGANPLTTTLLDQSHSQLMHATVRPSLAQVPRSHFIVGNSEALPLNWTRKFDRYISAGSVEYWPHPQDAIDEAIRVLRPGGKAMIIGPSRATNPISRFFCDLWYLFPEREEYIAWMTAAGFVDVSIMEVTPWWYGSDRSHGLIMGYVVVGTRPTGRRDTPERARNRFNARKAAFVGNSTEEIADANVLAAAARNDASTAATVGALLKESLLHMLGGSVDAITNPISLVRAIFAIPRFLLGSVGGTYYAVVPIYVYVRNMVLLGLGQSI